MHKCLQSLDNLLTRPLLVSSMVSPAASGKADQLGPIATSFGVQCAQAIRREVQGISKTSGESTIAGVGC
jgi:hypothetical protein